MEQASSSQEAPERPSMLGLPEVNPNSLDMCQIEIGPKIGEGQFAKVYIGRMGGEHVALKKQLLDEEGALTRWNQLELKVLQFCDHKHILKYVGCCVEAGRDVGEDDEARAPSTWIVTEYVACGDLLRLLEDATATIEWHLRLRIAKELTEALAYLHGRNLMHRDVKSSNVLLDGMWHVKLGDFGLATEVVNGRCSTICGTEEYMAPELHLGESDAYGPPADVYSTGVVFVEIATRTKAAVVAARSPRTRFALDIPELRRKMERAPESFVELAVQCVAYEDFERPTTDDALAWLEDLETERLEKLAATPSNAPETPVSVASGEASPVAGLPRPPPVPAFGGGETAVASREEDEPPSTPSRGTEDDEAFEGDSHDEYKSPPPPAAALEGDKERSASLDKRKELGATTDNSSDDARRRRARPPTQQQQQPPPAQQLQQSGQQGDAAKPRVLVPSAKGGLSLLAARRIHSLREVGIETTRMAGFLHKKARTTFHYKYQRRWFVLKRGTLLWFNAPGNANALGRVSLSSSAELVTTGANKFAVFARPLCDDSSRSSVLSPGSGRLAPQRSSSSAGSREASKRKPLLELQAPDETAKNMWLQALQTEIDERRVDDVKVTTSVLADARRPSTRLADAVAKPRYDAPVPSSNDDATTISAAESTRSSREATVAGSSSAEIAEWIDRLRLPVEIAGAFERAGYTNLRLILEVGLTDEDLEFIGVEVPIHRRILKTSVGEGFFEPGLVSQVQDYKIQGTAALYCVTSRYKYRRSRLYVKYSQFLQIFSKLKKIERARPPSSDRAHHPLPRLPATRNSITDSKGPSFQEKRRKELDDYLQATVVAASTDDKLLTALLHFLELDFLERHQTTEHWIPGRPPLGDPDPLD